MIFDGRIPDDIAGRLSAGGADLSRRAREAFLALSMRADLILIDERRRTSVAIAKGFTVTGPSLPQEMLDDLPNEFPHHT